MAVDEDVPHAEYVPHTWRAAPTRALGEYAQVHIVDDAAGPAIAVFAGELDLACADALADVLREALIASPRGLGLDMSEVSFCDCAALRALHTTLRLAHSLNRPFAIGPRSPAVARLLELAGATSIPVTDY